MDFIEVTPAFAVPLAFINFGEASRQLNQELIRDTEIQIQKDLNDKKNHKRSFWGNSWQTDSKLEETYQSFENLRLVIQKCTHEIMAQVGYHRDFIANTIMTSNLWANKTEDGGMSLPHWHGVYNTILAGVYYPSGFEDPDENLDEFDKSKYIFNVPSGKDISGSLVIESNGAIASGMAQGMTDTFATHDLFSTRKYVIPRQGLLVLFPATQCHYTLPKLGKRYSISFSVKRVDGESA